MKDRSVTECKCDGVKKWGYQAFFWRVCKWHMQGGPQPTAADAVKAVSRRRVVLITCRACGSEQLREYPSVAALAEETTT